MTVREGLCCGVLLSEVAAKALLRVVEKSARLLACWASLPDVPPDVGPFSTVRAWP